MASEYAYTTFKHSVAELFWQNCCKRVKGGPCPEIPSGLKADSLISYSYSSLHISSTQQLGPGLGLDSIDYSNCELYLGELCDLLENLFVVFPWNGLIATL